MNRKAREREKASGPDRRPFTGMVLCGLHAGLSMEDMRYMKHTALLQTVWEWEDLHDSDAHDETRDATADDFEFLRHMR